MKLNLFLVLVLASFLTACSSVSVEKMDEKSFKLMQNYNEPPNSLTSTGMKKKAWDVCPEGYMVEQKQAFKTGEFGRSYSECAEYESCDYVLEWKVRCTKRPKEKFSIFGST